MPHAQSCMRTGPNTSASVRSVSTEAPLTAMRWIFTSKPIRPCIPRNSFMVRARPRMVGKPTFW